MSSPEMEAFEITDEDYSGFSLNRNRGKWSKNHATYGVFLGDMVDSDDERPGLGKSGDRNGPINFISGGVKEDASNLGGEVDGNLNLDEDAKFKPKQNKFKVLKKNTSGFGNWEKHTKGIGWALIAKMGYKQGQGLGKNEQGIKAPVEVYQRKGKGALGFYGSEVPEGNKSNLKEVIANDNRPKIETKNWKKDPQKEKKKGKKFQLKTIDDAIAEGAQRLHFKSDVKVKVIDMTGKEQRVLSGYGALAHKSQQEDIHTKSRGFDLPELKNNLNVLCDTVEDEIVSSDRKKRNNADLLTNLEHEFDKKRILCEREEQFIEKLKDVLHIIDTAVDRSRDPMDPNTLKDCAIVAERLQNEYPDEYEAYDLGVFILALILPLFKTAVSNWQPLIDPFREGVAMYSTWKKILTEKRSSENFMNPYERLIWDTWIPSVRTAITSHWNGRDVEALALLDRWQHNLPDWILNNVLDHLILPKLQSAVNEWDPLSDRIPIHNWLLQWCPMMGDKLNPLYEAIRHKFANALVAWHPSDASAKFMLEPWNNVFQKGHMQAFLVRNVAPKLGQCLAEMDLSPNHLKLDLFNSVMTWIDLMPINSLVSLLDRHFFPRWLQTLCHWLNQLPNYDEVSRWYMGWKNIFPSVLLENSAVRDQFNTALDFMNRAVSGEKVQPSHSYNTQKPCGKINQAKFSTSATSLSYKDIIGKRAEENDIVFLPVANRTHESKQIYQFGRLYIYFDRNVLFVNEGGVWVPTSLNNLIDKAR